MARLATYRVQVSVCSPTAWTLGAAIVRDVVHRRRFIEAYGWSMVASSATGAATAGAVGRGHGRRREEGREGALKFRRRRSLPGRGRAIHGA